MRIEPGLITTRPEMKQTFGGGQGQGIQPCSETPNVLLYTDPASGTQYGYHDGWLPERDEDGHLFEYTGDGEGNQTFTGRFGSRNFAVLNHAEAKRSLRVFKADGLARDHDHLGISSSGMKAQRYVGEFKLDEKRAFEWRTQPNREGQLRRVIVFRLRPIDDNLTPDADDVIPSPQFSRATVLSNDLTTSSIVAPETTKSKKSARTAIAATVAERREAQLCDHYRAFLEGQRRRVGRFLLEVQGLRKPLVTDLYDRTAHVLYEAKGTGSREDVRMAIGQLMDYRHHVDQVHPGLLKCVAVLLPARPADDLCELLDLLNIALVYRDGNTFHGAPVE